MLIYFIIVFLVSLAGMLLLMPRLLPRLRALKLGQTIYALGPKHQHVTGSFQIPIRKRREELIRIFFPG